MKRPSKIKRKGSVKSAAKARSARNKIKAAAPGLLKAARIALRAIQDHLDGKADPQALPAAESVLADAIRRAT